MFRFGASLFVSVTSLMSTVCLLEEAKEQHTSKLSNFSETEWASDMTLQWSEEDDDDDVTVRTCVQ